MIKHHSLSKLDAIQVKPSQLVAYISERRRLGMGASTVNNDIIWLRNAFRAVRIARNIPLGLQVIDDASFLCRMEKLISKSTQRTRRVSLKELNNLTGCFDDRDARASMPMAEVILFALFSSRRQDEIYRIRWAGLDEENQRVLIRGMRHP